VLYPQLSYAVEVHVYRANSPVVSYIRWVSLRVIVASMVSNNEALSLHRANNNLLIIVTRSVVVVSSTVRWPVQAVDYYEATHADCISSLSGQDLVSDIFDKIHFFVEMDS